MGNATPSNATASRSKDIVVFWIISHTTCAECGAELGRGSFLRLEAERPLCGTIAAAKELDANAVELAVRAHIRHAHTQYDRFWHAVRIGRTPVARSRRKWMH